MLLLSCFSEQSSNQQFYLKALPVCKTLVCAFVSQASTVCALHKVIRDLDTCGLLPGTKRLLCAD